jgi:hypothetical protein
MHRQRRIYHFVQRDGLDVAEMLEPLEDRLHLIGGIRSWAAATLSPQTRW